MKTKEKLYVRNYFGIAILVNVILPILSAIIIIGKKTGEVQLGYVFVGVWGIICTLLYAIYFAIHKFNENWEKIVGILLPSIILSLGIIESWYFIIIVLINLIMNGIFIWHLKKKTFANTV
ncbi:hypothetical protein [Polaribacter sp. R77954]|uniref:hypothetical protein n=1 Tax=Polaribacter sp. R77954 TaxID=3093870 RepID=UPI0037CB0021